MMIIQYLPVPKGCFEMQVCKGELMHMNSWERSK